MATAEERELELSRIYNRDGCVKASVVVEEASKKRNPLHNEFEWDDQKAAHEHRLSTARRIIRVTPIKADDSPVKQRFVHVKPEPIEGPTAATMEREGYYKPVAVVARNESEYQRALMELLNQVRSIEQTINQLKRAAGKEPQLLPTLMDAMQIAKDTVRAMMHNAA